ncbi:MAG: ABC transporter permease [Desulfobacteraceae bacterium 4572_123]|nr:MAG: ABC transporter permease [Desulfobacteraceae bacterium 4572_123]
MILMVILAVVMVLGLATGSAGFALTPVIQGLTGTGEGSLLHDIVWRLRFPRVLLAAFLGATLSLGGLVFQALLRNPLAEPYILGISGGSAIGAIIGILMGLSRFPGVWLTSFAGSLSTLMVLYIMAAQSARLRTNNLLLSGVMVNAFCSAIIMFLISMTQDSRLHNILFWLMGDLSAVNIGNVIALGVTVIPCFVVIFTRSHAMNLFALGNDMARSMGVNVKTTSTILLLVTTLMVSATVSYCGLVGFVGLVIPHMLRLVLGFDHRILAPASILGGAAFLVICDTLARTLPEQGEMPVGVVTAMIGAPLFVYLLKKSNT